MKIDHKELAAAQHRRAERSARRAVKQPLMGTKVLLAGLFILVLVIALSFLIDGRRLSNLRASGPGGLSVEQDMAALASGLEGPRYTDPRGRFSIVPPAKWLRVPRSETGSYDVIWRGPLQTDLRIQTAVKPYSDFASLLREIERIEQDFGGEQNIRPIQIGGIPAIRRHGKLQESAFLAVDFIAGHMAYHVLCSIPNESLELYEPVLMEIIHTLQAHPVKTTESEPQPEAPHEY